MEIEISKIINNNWEGIRSIIIFGILIEDPEVPRRDKSKCPEIILAVSRIDRVIGRIKSLVSSINTIIGIKMYGVPDGVSLVSIWAGKFIHPYIIIPIHILRDKDAQNLRCLDDVKICGINPHKLLHRINKKIHINKIEFNLE